MFKILGTDDAVNTCDCCGKSNLKATVIVEVNGEILHYGSVCATRHTGMNAKEISHAIKDEYEARKMAAAREFYDTAENAALIIKQGQARACGIIGLAFKNFCDTEIKAADTKRKAISAKYNLEMYQF